MHPSVIQDGDTSRLHLCCSSEAEALHTCCVRWACRPGVWEDFSLMPSQAKSAAWSAACWQGACFAAAVLGSANDGGGAHVVTTCITAHLSAHILSGGLQLHALHCDMPRSSLVAWPLGNY